MKNNDSVPNNTNDFEYAIEKIRDLYYQQLVQDSPGQGQRKYN